MDPRSRETVSPSHTHLDKASQTIPLTDGGSHPRAASPEAAGVRMALCEMRAISSSHDPRSASDSQPESLPHREGSACFIFPRRGAQVVPWSCHVDVQESRCTPDVCRSPACDGLAPFDSRPLPVRCRSNCASISMNRPAFTASDAERSITRAVITKWAHRSNVHVVQRITHEIVRRDVSSAICLGGVCRRARTPLNQACLRRHSCSPWFNGFRSLAAVYSAPRRL